MWSIKREPKKLNGFAINWILYILSLSEGKSNEHYIVKIIDTKKIDVATIQCILIYLYGDTFPE